MKYEDFLDKLDGVKGSGTEHTALCPGHDDNQNSLSVGYDKQKRAILIKCHAGCDTGAVLGAMGLTFKDLYEGTLKTKTKARSQLGPIVQTYNYIDEGGALLFQVTRHEPKTFRQRRPDGAGGWTWSLNGTRRVLYNLPAVASGADDWVYVVEGEKDADRLISLGICATTSSGGAGNSKHTDWTILEGRRVAIIPDNDKSGRGYAEEVAQAVREIATEIRVVKLPGLGNKQDVSDWLDAGNTAADLRLLLDETEEWSADAPATPQTDSNFYMEALTDLGYRFQWNDLDDTIEVNGLRIDAGIAATIRMQMRDRGFSHAAPYEDTYTAHAYANRYHPVGEYLTGLRWDGDNHLGRLAQFIDDDHPPIVYDRGEGSVISAWLGKWMIGAVAKVFDSGLVRAQNPMLVLDGPQSLGKSVFVSWLASPLPHLFVESPINPDDKEHNRYLASKWIWEVAELGATTRRADREALKAFITKAEVTFRKPYDRHPVVKPALASFIGTINNEVGFLTDPTGNRRFLTVRLKRIDWRYAEEIDIHQVWAQAVALYHRGAKWMLTPSELQQRDKLNRSYEVEDEFEAWILKYYEIDPTETEWTVTSADIADRLQTVGVKGTTRAVQMGVAGTLRKMGVEQDTNQRPRVWRGIREKITPTSEHQPT